MYKLEINNTDNLGGHRVSLDDFFYLQEGVKDVASAFSAMFGLGFSDVILSEIRIDDHGATFDLEIPAVVMYNGEMYKVEAGFAQPKGGVGSEFKFQIITEINPDDPVLYASGTPKNIHVNKYMKLVHTNLTGSDYVALADFTAAAWVSYTPATVNGLTFAGGGESLSLKYRVVGKTLMIKVNMIGQKVIGVTPEIQLPWNLKFKDDGRQVFSGITPPVAVSGVDNLIVAFWNAGETNFRLGTTDVSSFTEGAIEMYGVLITEIE